MNKRGQFFLIAALVIAGIIVTLAAVNISTKTSDTRTGALYDLSKEIDFESSSLIDYGIVTGGSTDIALEALISSYSKANPESDIYFIYGNSVGGFKRTAYYLVPIVSTTVGDSGSGVTTTAPKSYHGQTADIIENNNVEVKLESDNSIIRFNLNPGENFFIVLKKEVGGEKIVAQK